MEERNIGGEREGKGRTRGTKDESSEERGENGNGPGKVGTGKEDATR